MYHFQLSAQSKQQDMMRDAERERLVSLARRADGFQRLNLLSALVAGIMRGIRWFERRFRTSAAHEPRWIREASYPYERS